MDALFWLAAGALALYAFAFVSLVLRVRGTVVRRPVHRVLPPEEVPAWLSTFAAPAVERLSALGFRPFGALASVAMDRQSDDETVDLVFHEPESGTYAFVYLPPTVPGARPLSVDFATWGADGRLRLTLAQSPGPTHRDVPGTAVVGLPELSLGRRFARHVFETAGMTTKTLEPVELAAELTRRNGAALTTALAAGEVCTRPGGVFSHTLLGTARLVGRILQGLLRPVGAGAAFHGAYGPDRVGEPAPPEHQAVVHHELSCLAAGRRRPGRALLVFVLSLALFVLSIAGRVDALVLSIVVGVLLLHELGHFAAMRAFGYRDTSVFFLPFLGAAAAGSKPEASVSERAIVLLAGPVPGLLLGLWWFHAPVGAVGGTAAVILVAVNLSNLLPVSPLDGGRLVERVFFASSPGGALLFKAASALLFIGTGLFFGVGLVTVIGIVVAAGLPVGLWVARVAAHWESPNPPADRAALYALVDGAGYAGLRFSRKLALVQALEQRFAAPPSSPAVRWAWFAVYLALLAAGLYGGRDVFAAFG